MNNLPLVTIITVCYNAAETLEKTISSVINQTYSNIEYIIIDGGSTDGTIEIIKKHKEKIHYWISEPDNGVYDAMNKGIEFASGEWINYMNSGDSFCEETTIENIFCQNDFNVDIIYGNTILLYSLGNYIHKGKRISPENYMPFGHQAAFTRRELLRKYRFDTKYKICADRSFYHTAYINNATYQYYDINIANYEAEEGLSSVNWIDLINEIALIEGKTKDISWKLQYYRNIFFFKLKQTIKSLLPKKFTLIIKSFNLKRKHEQA